MSARLRRYVARAALRAFLLVAASLTGLLGLLEFVEQLASVGQGRYRVADALAYVALTTPGRLLQVMPVSMLLAALLSLGSLARTSELTAMRALGVSERAILATVLALVAPIAAALLLLAQFAVPPAQQRAQDLRAAAMGPAYAQPSDNAWAHDGREYLDVARVEPGGVPTGIDIYDFRPDGSLESLVHAARARVAADGTWTLEDVTRRTVTDSLFATEHLPRLDWRSFVPRAQLAFLTLPPDSLPPLALARRILALRHRHQNAARDERALWTRLAIPVSMAALTLLAGPLVFGSPRAQGGNTLTRGIGIGIAFTLAQQILGRLGELLALDPALTALGPPLLLLGVAVALLPGGGRAGEPQGSE